ncbi:Cyclin-D2-1 [Morella rubra]|uniref:B-like cyclin n=1 Tax=Morella rubra TaxID=262757 RepID=A0A6A1VWE4_9ROSI|nr:Cyclin-D2-1 [Morella rubra]
MGDPDTLFSPSDLLWLKAREFSSIPFPANEDEEYIEKMVQGERFYYGSKSFVLEPGTKLSSWLKTARNISFAHILKLRELLHLKNRTAYISMTYYDRFLSIQPITEGELCAIQALQITCFALARKVESFGTTTLLSSEAEREVPITEMVPRCHLEDCHFENEQIVLGALGEDRKLLVESFVLEIDEEVVSRAEKLIMDVSLEISNIRDHRPSVIAAAAVILASNVKLTREAVDDKMSLIPSLWSLANIHEQVFSCLHLMQYAELLNIIRQPLASTPNPEDSSTVHCLVGVVKCSSSPVALRIERKLPFLNGPRCPFWDWLN